MKTSESFEEMSHPKYWKVQWNIVPDENPYHGFYTMVPTDLYWKHYHSNYPTTPVPEMSTFGYMLGGLLLMVFFLNKLRKI